MTFGFYADQWLTLKRQDIGYSQYIAYKCSLKHLQPIFYMEIDEIRVNDIQAIITALSACNPTTKKPTAKKTLSDAKMTAKQVFQYAIDLRDIAYNPAESVKIPRNAPKSTRRALTVEEREIITNTPHPTQTAAMIMLYGGLRRGEVIALRYSDIDLEHGTITVNKSVDLTKNQPIIKATKTKAGNRFVQIPKILTDFLSQRKSEILPNESDIVIAEKILSASSWRKRWSRYLKDVGLDGVTPHMLRHTACTMMIESGMDVSSVKNQMGHSDIQTTLEIYTHITQKHTINEVKKLDTYIANSNSEISKEKSQKQETFSFFSL